MDNKIMDDLINEIDNMSTEEYLKYHKEAVKMKQSYDNMMKALSSRCAEDQKELDMEAYQLPGLDKPSTNGVFNCLNALCKYMETFFEVNNDGKDFVFKQIVEKTGKTITITIAQSE